MKPPTLPLELFSHDANKRRGEKAKRSKPKKRRDGQAHALHVYRCQLVEERTIPVLRRRVHHAGHAAELLTAYYDRIDREQFAVLMLDGHNNVLGANTVAIGSVAAVEFAFREVFKAPILHNAERICVCHNHLDGNVRPSKEDIRLTRQLVKAGEILGIRVSDHIILGKPGGTFYSFLECGPEGLIRCD